MPSQLYRTPPPRSSASLLTNHNPIGKDEELDVWSEGTEHQATCHHYATEDGYGTCPKVVHAGTAHRTYRERSKKDKQGRREREREKK